jgi:hypothetical protein
MMWYWLTIGITSLVWLTGSLMYWRGRAAGVMAERERWRQAFTTLVWARGNSSVELPGDIGRMIEELQRLGVTLERSEPSGAG